MNYWVIKTRLSTKELNKRIVYGTEDTWETEKKIPNTMNKGDIVFIWQGNPTLKIVGFAKCSDIAESEFSFKYLSPYLDTKLNIDYLRSDKQLIQEHDPSFLKQGAAGTIFPLTPHQGERLMSLIELYNDFLSNDIKDINDSDLLQTEKEELTKCRMGQGKFRNDLIEYWKSCSITHIDKIDILIASHIKPWRESTDKERLDKYNGLLLLPNLDKLFDKGYISFSDNGGIIINSTINDYDKLGLNKNMKIDISTEHKKYLKFHRENIFIK